MVHEVGTTNRDHWDALATAPLDRIAAHQIAGLQRALREILPTNRFYRRKLESVGLGAADEISSLAQMPGLPFTTKAELVADQAEHPPYGTNLTYEIDRYTRIHQTSGTSGGQPLRVLDTPESWEWWIRCWRLVLAEAGVTSRDRLFCAFSFGPFIGFWAGFEAAPRLGALAIPGGGLDSIQRLRAIHDLAVTVLLCTPTYALRLAEVARQSGMDAALQSVRTIVSAGEPGASIPATRRAIDEAWGARCYDHTGMSEMGATGFSCGARSGVHLIVPEFIFEVIDPATGRPVSPGARGELVITNLGRLGFPAIRYRTGDLVQVDESPCVCGRTWPRLAGGILGRVDDMIVIRGINVFPSSIEDIVREFADVVEFRLELRRERQMDELALAIEPSDHLSAEEGERLATRVGAEIQRRLLLRVPCRTLPPNSLPRFELKARRVVRVD